MTPGLAKSRATKSMLLKNYKCCKTEEARTKLTIYRNKLNGLLKKAEARYYALRLEACQGDMKKHGILLTVSLIVKRTWTPPALF